MPAIAVIGAQWGDEGKGKVVDYVAAQSDMVIRFSGGDNAGHTVVNHLGKFALHLVPSGIFSPNAVSIIGNGVAVNPESLFNELDMLSKRGIDVSPGHLYISDRTHVIMPYHIILDGLEEASRGGKAIGTTGKGIGPVYQDKIARQGIRMGDLIDKRNFFEQLRTQLDRKNTIITKVYGAQPLSLVRMYEDYRVYAKRLQPYIIDATLMIEEALRQRKIVMLEGAQGTMLDPDFGTYPFATSSSPLAGGGCVGAGVSPRSIKSILGVYKAYCTRVGGGPFPTEMLDAIGEHVRERAQEFGTTTGRPRRCGWFDAVAGRFSNRINGFTGMALTRFDILDDLDTVKICTAYRVDGRTITAFPASIPALERCEPIYEELPGWKTSTCDVRNFNDLPPNARKYVRRVEQLIGCPASIISVGAERGQTVVKRPVV